MGMDLAQVLSQVFRPHVKIETPLGFSFVLDKNTPQHYETDLLFVVLG